MTLPNGDPADATVPSPAAPAAAAPVAPAPAPPPGDDEEDEGWQAPAKPLVGMLAVVCAASVVGALFSMVSTSDFIQHLDRQMHSIHCSFIPGAGSELGESGCRTVMMSPYSSFFRERLWGGVPVALWSLAVFAFLSYRAGLLAWRGTASRAEAKFLLAAAGLPLGMSVVYGLLSAFELGTTCQVCVGIYLASAAAFIAAWVVYRRVPPPAGAQYEPSRFGWWFAEGVGFVALLTLVFLAAAPAGDGARSEAGCGSLAQADDPSGVMIEMSGGKGSVPSIEVLDPLCPSCRAFDARLMASGLGRELSLKGVLFPLDSSCNWMVTGEIHPGACAVSEAILCAGGLGPSRDAAAANRVLHWAFAHQEELRTQAKKDEKALRQRLEAEFPAVKGCLGGAQVRNRLTKSLRWGVANAIPVLTPQLFVQEKRMCDEDTDLGLEYTLRRMLSKRGGAAGKASR
ncbi:MAG: vitamin K epoxide reductase/DsbA family protein [Myxococcaceae bacterium]